MTATKTKPAKETKAADLAKAPPPETKGVKPETNGKKGETANGKTAKPIVDKETRILESWQRLEKLHQNYVAASAILKDAESELKEAKDNVSTAEGNCDELNRKIHQVLEEIKNPSPIYAVQPLPNGKPAEMKHDDSWREVPVKAGMPGLGKRVYTALDNARVETMGQLADIKGKDRWVAGIKGIKEAGVTAIDDAEEAFHKEWQKNNPPKPVAAKDGKADDKGGKKLDDLKAGNSSAPAGDPLVPEVDPAVEYDAILADVLANFKTIKDDGALRTKLSEAKLSTVADVFTQRTAGGFKTAFDCLRGLLGDMAYADVVWEAIKARAKEVSAK